MRRLRQLSLLLICLTLCSGSTCTPIGGALTDPVTGVSPSASFIHASGKTLEVGAGTSAKMIQLRGINVQNFWLLLPNDTSNPFFNDDNDQGVPMVSVIPTRFDKTVVSNIASMGMNVIRNEINFRQFEDNGNPFVYKPEGWALLDQQIKLAKDAGLYTIIDLHVPPGGLQGVVGQSARLWEDSKLRERTKALWQAIAERYRDEPWVAAYDLINEPMPTQNPGQWASFAQELVDVIRQVDTNHLIIVEEILAVVDAQGNYPNIDPTVPFIPKVSDNNVMYDFHFYRPSDFVSQGREETGIGDTSLAYPDKTKQFFDDAGNVIGVLDKAFLKRMLDEKLAFQQTYNVPINVGEFSPSRLTFMNSDAKGGLEYTADLMSLMNAAGLNHQFFAYLNVFFLDWEYDATPELFTVTDSLKTTLKTGMQ